MVSLLQRSCIAFGYFRLAPEVLIHAYHDKPADVWAFGVLCWEIYSDADMPYKECTVCATSD